ncbi:MAG TPA: carbohydrate porin [Povalibacter sp.]|nr:carbohydrate porin [Povalibacter sp.]
MRQFLAMCLLVGLSTAASAEGQQCADCVAAPAVSVASTYTGEMWRNVSGGQATGDRYLDNLDITFDVNGGRLFGAEGMELFAYLLYNNGHSIAELSDAAQGISNIESTRAVRLYELWTQWQFGGASSSLRFGLYDLNSEFDSIETAGLFINPSHGIGPDFSQSGTNGPSIFPTTSLALRGLTTHGRWTFQAAALDGVPGDTDHPDRSGIHLSSAEGAVLVGEVNYRLESGLRLGAGYWRYTAKFAELEATDAAGASAQGAGNAGFYAIAESPTFFAYDASQGVRFFVRTGVAEDRFNPIHRYYGAGLVYTGWARRPQDQIGFAVAVAEPGAPFRQSQQGSGVGTASECDYEITYRFSVNDWLTLQSDVQYVRHPGMNPSVDPAWVVGLRFEAGYGWSW